MTAMIGIFGNLLIIFLLMKRGLKSAVDILIINLSAADCLYCLGLPIWANGMFKLVCLLKIIEFKEKIQINLYL